MTIRRGGDYDMNVSDIRNIARGDPELVHKKVGVFLHDGGFMRYRKLTPENYYCWWYEVDNPSATKPRKNVFTYEWADMETTEKFGVLLELAKYHDADDSLCTVANNALNLIEAWKDGINTVTGRRCCEEVFDMCYGRRKPKAAQGELF